MLEICANSVESAIIAQEGGACRIELCNNLKEGGTTPSYGHILIGRQQLNIPLYVIIRPREGDFLYSASEFGIMKQDIKMCKEIGADGIVFGILKEDGTVDMKRCAELLKLASPMKATFHRAFDTCPDFSAALENIISLGFERILTSGGEPTAFVGAKTIKRLIQQAAGRISIMPGGGITEQNVKETALITGATEFHASARKPVDSKMHFRNAERVPEESRNDFGIERTDLKTVKNLVRLLQATT